MEVMFTELAIILAECESISPEGAGKAGKEREEGRKEGRKRRRGGGREEREGMEKKGGRKKNRQKL